MLRRNGVRCFNDRQLGPHARGGTYSSILSRRHDFEGDRKSIPMSSENMEPGKVYQPAEPGRMAQRPDYVPSPSNIAGMGDKVVPHKLLSLDRVFTHVEKGNIVPRPYIETVVEPVSADAEKHPVPVLNFWHKVGAQDRLTSYGVACKDIVTEGKEANPFFEHRHPGLQQTLHDVKRKTERRIGNPRGWIARTAWWKRGARRPNKYILEKKLTKGANPWWASAHKARWKTEGTDTSQIGRTPQYAFWKYLPILGYQGWGTLEGEINVEDQYVTVGLDEIQWWVDTGMLNTNETITPNTLVEARCVDDYHWPGLKLVTNNCTWFRAEIDIEMESADPEAVKIVRQNGGSVTTRWRDEEGIVKEKTPWRFPVIAGGKLPPEELIRDLYAKDERGGYLTDYYQKKLRVTNLESPRQWSLLEKTPEEIGEIPPEKEELVAVPRSRRAREASLQKKQDYFEDALAGTAGTAEGRLGKVTPSSFYLWEYTYFMKQGPGHMSKREPPEGLEETQFPGYPYRDSRYYSFVESDISTQASKKAQSEGATETPYDVTETSRAHIAKKKPWELKGEGWRDETDSEVNYRNPYNNPYLKDRIEAWQKKQKKIKDNLKKRGIKGTD